MIDAFVGFHAYTVNICKGKAIPLQTQRVPGG
jgi:hypothetical protein